MIKILVFIILIILVSCKDFSKVVEEKDGVSILPVDASIEHAKILKWKVGVGFRDTVSKGVLVKILFPSLKFEDIELLGIKYSADSWIVRVSKNFAGRRKVLGEMYVRMQAPALKRVTPIKTAYFSLYYAAAYPSKRFENFKCPAFNHRKLIGNVDIRDREAFWEKMAIGNYNYGSREINLQKFSVRPVTVNSGMTLEGQYIVEIAVYSIEEKIRKSSYIEYPKIIVISEESDVAVAGCEGSKIPKKDEKRFEMRDFKFGR